MAPPTPEMQKTALTKVHSLKVAIFHTMAYKMSTEINNNAITESTKRSFVKILYTVCRIKQKHINFEQYFRAHTDGPKIAIFETTSESDFVLHSAFSTNDQYFQVALDEAIDAFNAVLVDFGYTQKLQRYLVQTHQTYPKQKHPFWT